MIIEAIISEYKRYKSLADLAIEQVDKKEFHQALETKEIQLL